jgi:hypothetical protein
VAGELARAIGLPVPELVTIDIDARLVRAEPDPEIQELVAGSAGSNLGVDFLPGALPFSPGPVGELDPAFAADVVWFDALMTNVDRTPRNPNLLVWHGRTWLIDHGAALFRQHGDVPLAQTARTGFPMIGDHILLGRAGPLADADARLAQRAADAAEDTVAAVPDDWVTPERRADLVAFLRERLTEPRSFVSEAEHARP